MPPRPSLLIPPTRKHRRRRKAPGDSSVSFASVKMADIVDLIPFYCEKKGYGPGVADEGRSEAMICNIKNRTSSQTDDPLTWLPHIYSTVAEERRHSRQTQKAPLLAHSLEFAASEILAPCVFESIVHLKDNWEDFCKRWSPRYSRFWHKYSGAYKFAMEPVARTRFLHCPCGKHYHLMLISDEEWQPVE